MTAGERQCSRLGPTIVCALHSTVTNQLILSTIHYTLLFPTLIHDLFMNIAPLLPYLSLAARFDTQSSVRGHSKIAESEKLPVIGGGHLLFTTKQFTVWDIIKRANGHNWELFIFSTGLNHRPPCVLDAR